jgi:hypothetical protein
MRQYTREQLNAIKAEEEKGVPAGMRVVIDNEGKLAFEKKWNYLFTKGEGSMLSRSLKIILIIVGLVALVLLTAFVCKNIFTSSNNNAMTQADITAAINEAIAANKTDNNDGCSSQAMLQLMLKDKQSEDNTLLIDAETVKDVQWDVKVPSDIQNPLLVVYFNRTTGVVKSKISDQESLSVDNEVLNCDELVIYNLSDITEGTKIVVTKTELVAGNVLSVKLDKGVFIMEILKKNPVLNTKFVKKNGYRERLKTDEELAAEGKGGSSGGSTPSGPSTPVKPDPVDPGIVIPEGNKTKPDLYTPNYQEDADANTGKTITTTTGQTNAGADTEGQVNDYINSNYG